MFKEYEDVTAYRKYAIKRRDSKYIYASLKEVSPMVEIKQDRLDSNEFLLNTPKATYDLRYGASKMHEHTAEDYITKQTTLIHLMKEKKYGMLLLTHSSVRIMT